MATAEDIQRMLDATIGPIGRNLSTLTENFGELRMGVIAVQAELKTHTAKLEGHDAALRDLKEGHAHLERRVLAAERAATAPASTSSPSPPSPGSGVSTASAPPPAGSPAGGPMWRPGVVLRGWSPPGSGVYVSAAKAREIGEAALLRLGEPLRGLMVMARPWPQSWQVTLRLTSFGWNLGHCAQDIVDALRQSLDGDPLVVEGQEVFATLELAPAERARRRWWAQAKHELELQRGLPEVLQPQDVRQDPRAMKFFCATSGRLLGEALTDGWVWHSAAVAETVAARGLTRTTAPAPPAPAAAASPGAVPQAPAPPAPAAAAAATTTTAPPPAPPGLLGRLRGSERTTKRKLLANTSDAKDPEPPGEGDGEQDDFDGDDEVADADMPVPEDTPIADTVRDGAADADTIPATLHLPPPWTTAAAPATS